MNLRNPRLVLAAIVLLFFGPVLLAVWMHSERWGFAPSGTSNLGTLVQPPINLGLEESLSLKTDSTASGLPAWTVVIRGSA